MTATEFVLNGKTVAVTARVGERLSETLRERLDAKDVKIGCNAGDCGACSVLVDGELICACLMPAQQAAGRRVETAAGLAQQDSIARRLGESFQDHGATQCGICTPGVMVAAVALLRNCETPNEQQVQDALGGVLCRCTGYRKIIDAIVSARPQHNRSGIGHVGERAHRVGGVQKISGQEIYADDVAPENTLQVLLIRSPHSRAGFYFGDLDGFVSANPGVEAVLTAADIKGENRFGVLPGFEDQVVFADSEARFRGEAVAAVVASIDFIADYDPADFPVSWEPRTALQTMDEAIIEGAYQLHTERDGNILCKGRVQQGDAESALASADVVVEGRFRSGFVEHAYIEPEAGFAQVVEGRLEVYACTQSRAMATLALSRVLGLEPEELRVVPTGIGGGFGSKLDLSVQPYLALAALKTGKPVRLTYSRRESMQSTTKRHPSDITIKVGATKDGLIKGFQFRALFNTGAYASWGPTVANRVPVHASGPYRISAYHAEATAIHTNNPPSGAFRGFGVPQATIAHESLYDDLANELGIDRLEFRIRNALQNGVPTVCGQVFEQGVGIRACLQALQPAWDEECESARRYNSESKVLKRGVGVACGWYGCGNTSYANPSTIKSGIRADGTVVLHQGAMDIGQGSNTVISQIFATALGVPLEILHLICGEHDLTPDAGKTSGSRQTFVSGRAAQLSGEALRSQILALAKAEEDAVLEFGDGMITVRCKDQENMLNLASLSADDEGFVLRAEETYDPPTEPLDENGQGVPYAQFGYAAQLAVVEVDTQLGTIKPIKFVAAHDVGKAINPTLVEGQIQGGIAQGLGLALMEEYLPGCTENLHDYLIPTIGDVPPIATILVEETDAHGPYGAKGVGELVLIPAAPALLNAIKHACGNGVREIPATPERVLAALKDGATVVGN